MFSSKMSTNTAILQYNIYLGVCIYGNRIVIGDRRINSRPFAETFTSTTIYYKVGTRLALRVHALHCFFFLRT